MADQTGGRLVAVLPDELLDALLDELPDELLDEALEELLDALLDEAAEELLDEPLDELLDDVPDELPESPPPPQACNVSVAAPRVNACINSRRAINCVELLIFLGVLMEVMSVIQFFL
jgi:hypothetical protein